MTDTEATTVKPFATVTGTLWIKGVAQTVTGFPIRQGLTTSTVAFLTLLTESGAVISDVQVDPAALDGVRVKDLAFGARDEYLWKVADSPVLGRGGRSARYLAELAMRDRQRQEQAEREQQDRIARSRRDAARLLAA